MAHCSCRAKRDDLGVKSRLRCDPAVIMPINQQHSVYNRWSWKHNRQEQQDNIEVLGVEIVRNSDLAASILEAQLYQRQFKPEIVTIKQKPTVSRKHGMSHVAFISAAYPRVCLSTLSALHYTSHTLKFFTLFSLGCECKFSSVWASLSGTSLTKDFSSTLDDKRLYSSYLAFTLTTCVLENVPVSLLSHYTR